MYFPLLISIRVYFVLRANKSPLALHRLCRHCELIKIFHCVYQMKYTTFYYPLKITKETPRRLEAHGPTNKQDPITQLLHFPKQKFGVIKRVDKG